MFDPKGQDIGFADKLSEKFTLNAQVGLELICIVMKPELVSKYCKKLTLQFGDPKLRHTMTLARLTEVRFDLRESVKQTLKDLKEQEILENVYIVLVVS